MSNDRDIQLTISSRQNTLTVVSIVLELPVFYSLHDIIEFLEGHNFLALFKEDVALETQSGVQLNRKLILKDVVGAEATELVLFATRKSAISSRISRQSQEN